MSIEQLRHLCHVIKTRDQNQNLTLTLIKRQDLCDTYENVLREFRQLPKDIIQYCILPYLVNSPDQVIHKHNLMYVRIYLDYLQKSREMFGPILLAENSRSRSQFFFQVIKITNKYFTT